jgi:exodeoxyribonuclease V alpha subunit
MKKGSVGVIDLNERLQQLCNPPSPAKEECKTMGIIFRIGDKVMQTRNDYRMEWKKDNGAYVENGLGVFNGDMGEIMGIDNAMQEVTVRFDDDRVAVYEFAQADELERSYAITVHKSQGSEFEEIAIPILNGPPMLYTRNLLYTAITRAKKRVWLLGRKYAISTMIANDRTKERYTGLQQALGDNYHAST